MLFVIWTLTHEANSTAAIICLPDYGYVPLRCLLSDALSACFIHSLRSPPSAVLTIRGPTSWRLWLRDLLFGSVTGRLLTGRPPPSILSQPLRQRLTHLRRQRGQHLSGKLIGLIFGPRLHVGDAVDRVGHLGVRDLQIDLSG